MSNWTLNDYAEVAQAIFALFCIAGFLLMCDTACNAWRY